jgi:hypothetical protein
MALLAQVTVSVHVPPAPGQPGLGLSRTGFAGLGLLVLALAVVALGTVVVLAGRSRRGEGNAR